MPIVTLSIEDKLELLRRDTAEYIQEVGDFNRWVAGHRCRKVTHGRVMQYLRMYSKVQPLSITVTKPEYVEAGRQDLLHNARIRERASALYVRWDALAAQWGGGRVAFDVLEWHDA